MDICDRTETALAGILPVYGRTPEFGADEPKEYAVYIITEKPAEFGEGEEYCTEFLVRVSVFTPKPDFGLYCRIKAAMRKAGFGYCSGGLTGTDGLFPYVTHYYLDFTGVWDDE